MYYLTDNWEKNKSTRDEWLYNLLHSINTEQPLKWFVQVQKNIHMYTLGSLVGEMVKNLPVMQETQVPSLGWEDPLEKGMATHSSAPVWRIPWTEEPSGFQYFRSQRVSHNWVTNIFTFLLTFHTLLPFFCLGKKERQRWELDYMFVFVCIYTRNYERICKKNKKDYGVWGLEIGWTEAGVGDFLLHICLKLFCLLNHVNLLQAFQVAQW